MKKRADDERREFESRVEEEEMKFKRLLLNLGSVQERLCIKRRSFVFGIVIGFLASLIVMPFFEDCGSIHLASSNNSRVSKVESMNWFQHIIISDYNPVVNLNPDNQTQRNSLFDLTKGKNIPLVKRPRYYSTELGIKSNLLICILTTPHTYSTLGKTLNSTLNHHGDKVILFMEPMDDLQSSSHSPLVSLVTIPSNRSLYFAVNNQRSQSTDAFAFYYKVLNYLFTQPLSEDGTTYIQNFNYVLLVKDHSHVKSHDLQKHLKKLRLSQSVFSLATEKEYHRDTCSRISPETDIESGLLLNRNFMLECGFNESCWKFYCLNSHLETYLLEYDKNDDLNIDINAFSNAIISYPLYTSHHRFQLHRIYLDHIQHEMLNILRQNEQELSDVHAILGTAEWPLGVHNRFKAKNRFDVIRWWAFNDTHALMPNDFETASPLKKDDYEDILHLKQLCANHIRGDTNLFTNETDFNIRFKNIYRRFDPTRGMEYIVDVFASLTKLSEQKLFRLEVVKPLNPVELMTEVPYVTENSKVILLVPIVGEGEVNAGVEFLQEYANSCLQRANHQTVLILVLVYKEKESSQSDVYEPVRSLATSLQNKYKNTSPKISVIELKTTKHKLQNPLLFLDVVNASFSRSVLESSVILMCKTRAIFNYDFINRVRLNTIKSFQVFFPVPFVEYKLRPEKQTNPVVPVKKGQGHFFEVSSQICSFYFSDYISARYAIKEIIPVPSSVKDIHEDNYYDTDWDLLRLFLHHNCEGSKVQLHIFKGVEPELKLVYHNEPGCDKELLSNGKSECQAYSIFRVGTKSQLAAAILNYEQSRNIDNRLSESKAGNGEDD